MQPISNMFQCSFELCHASRLGGRRGLQQSEEIWDDSLVDVVDPDLGPGLFVSSVAVRIARLQRRCFLIYPEADCSFFTILVGAI